MSENEKDLPAKPWLAAIPADPPVEPLRLPEPDGTFRLSPAERARCTQFDIDAVERLLSMIHPELRRRIKHHFVEPLPGEVEPGERIGWLTHLFDPNTGEVDPLLQAVLEEAYAPLWAELSDAEVEDPHSTFYPGRERERRRRERQGWGG